MNITTREATSSDVTQLTELLAELFAIEEDFNVDEQKQRAGLLSLIASEKDCVMIADCEGQVVGMCSIQTFISTAEGGPVGLLEDLVVARDFRGKGIGQLLLNEIERWSHTSNLTRLQLFADRNNQPALSFYQKLGWKETQLVGLRKTHRKV